LAIVSDVIPMIVVDLKRLASGRLESLNVHVTLGIGFAENGSSKTCEAPAFNVRVSLMSPPNFGGATNEITKCNSKLK